MGKHKRQKNYYLNSAKRQKQQHNHVLRSGLKGFLCTCNFHERDCVREAYNLLNQFADRLYGPEDLKKGNVWRLALLSYLISIFSHGWIMERLSVIVIIIVIKYKYYSFCHTLSMISSAEPSQDDKNTDEQGGTKEELVMGTKAEQEDISEGNAGSGNDDDDDDEDIDAALKVSRKF